jgi:hypothetical protein
MARIENTSEREIHLSGGGQVVIIPRGHMGDDRKTNGVAEIDDEIIAATKKDPVVKAWFASGDLVIKTAAEVKADAKEAADEAKADAKEAAAETKAANVAANAAVAAAAKDAHRR